MTDVPPSAPIPGSPSRRALLRGAWERLRGGPVTPRRAAASVGFGLAVGVTPLYGLHTPIVLAVCVPLRWDARLAWLATQISMPWIAPLLAFVEVELGALARTGALRAVDVATFRGTFDLRSFLVDLALGTAIFAPAIGLVGGAVAYGVAALAARRRLRGAP